MAKIVYNACYGGFSLSDAGIRRYAELKGLTLYPEKGKYSFITYWTVPEDQRGPVLKDADFYKAPMDARRASNEFYSRNSINSHRFERHDPILAQVIEELGEAASGKYAKLKIAEVESGTLYRIDEYDGMENVATNDTYEWTVAP